MHHIRGVTIDCSVSYCIVLPFRVAFYVDLFFLPSFPSCECADINYNIIIIMRCITLFNLFVHRRCRYIIVALCFCTAIHLLYICYTSAQRSHNYCHIYINVDCNTSQLVAENITYYSVWKAILVYSESFG